MPATLQKRQRKTFSNIGRLSQSQICLKGLAPSEPYLPLMEQSPQSGGHAEAGPTKRHRTVTEHR
jgi:hypothetical protein